MWLNFPLSVRSRKKHSVSTREKDYIFTVFLATIPEKGISDFIAHGSIIQVFTVLEPRISHHGNRAHQVEGVGEQLLLTGISELVRWYSLWGTRQFGLVLPW